MLPGSWEVLPGETSIPLLSRGYTTSTSTRSVVLAPPSPDDDAAVPAAEIAGSQLEGATAIQLCTELPARAGCRGSRETRAPRTACRGRHRPEGPTLLREHRDIQAEHDLTRSALTDADHDRRRPGRRIRASGEAFSEQILVIRVRPHVFRRRRGVPRGDLDPAGLPRVD